MSKNKIFAIVSIVALFGGVILGTFTDVANDLPAIALTAFGLGGLIIQTWNKSENKNGYLIASIICMVICGLSAAFAEMAQETFSKLIAAIVALVALVVSILIPVVSKSFQKKKE